MTAQMTEWYPPEIKPVRVGWYESTPWLKYGDGDRNWWNGRQWIWFEKGYPCSEQSRHWRGLAADPAVAK
jgi:hypothetical protein